MDYTLSNAGQTAPFYKKTASICGPRVSQSSLIQQMVFKDIEKYGNFTLGCQPVGYYQVKNFRKELDARISGIFPDFDGAIHWYFWTKKNRQKIYYFNMTFMGKYN